MKLLIFDTHPIQYHSPVFRELYRRCPDVKVCLFDEEYQERRLPLAERNTVPEQPWGLDLLEGFPYEILGVRDLGVRRFGKVVDKMLRSEPRPGAVLVYGYYLPEHWMIRHLSAQAKVPLLFIGDTFFETAKGPRAWVKRPFLRWFFSGVANFISVGNKNEAFYRSKGIPKERITSAKHCVDDTFFTPQPGARERFRERIGIPSDAHVVLLAARLFARKRPLDALEIHRKLSTDPKVHTVIAGNGLMEAEVAETARQLPRAHVIGFQNQDQMREAYVGADVLLVTSTFETWGLVINEAMSCGVPAVVTDMCGAADDLVVRGDTGEVFPVGDTACAAALIEALFKDPERLRRTAARAKAKVNAEFGVSQFAEALLKAADAAAKSRS